VLRKVRGEGGVRQRLKAGGVVGNDVLWSWEVGHGVEVAVEALVITGNLAEVGSRPDGGDCAFAGAGHSRGVVREVFDGGVADVVAVGHDVRLSNEGRLF
jgi:hypothetical protein